MPAKLIIAANAAAFAAITSASLKKFDFAFRGNYSAL